MPDYSNTPLNKKQQRLEKKRTAVSRACAFYRANPHRFAKDYMNLNLRLSQKLLLFFMNWATNFLLIAARGLSKTFLANRDIIATYTGKIDIDQNDGGYVKFDFEGSGTSTTTVSWKPSPILNREYGEEYGGY